MAALRTLDEIYAAGAELVRDWEPPTQEQMDRCYAILAPHLQQLEAAAA